MVVPPGGVCEIGLCNSEGKDTFIACAALELMLEILE
jgi:hypothetical protein